MLPALDTVGAMRVAAPERPTGDDATPPRWCTLVALSGALLIAGVGVVGLLLAIVGRYSAGVSLVIGVPLAAAGALVLARWTPRDGSTRGARAGAALAVLFGVGHAVFAGLTPSQNVLVNRDPGSYLATAMQLVTQGALEVDARGDAFAGVPGLTFDSAAVYDGCLPGGEAAGECLPGMVEPQFNHLTSVLLATVHEVGGVEPMIRLPAVLGGLGLVLLYLATVRVSRRPLLALLAPALLAVCQPLLFVSRNTYSEAATLVLLWAALLVLAEVHRRPRVAPAVVGGALLGALVCVRMDSLVYVCLLFPLVAVSLCVPARPGVRAGRLRAWAAGLATAGAVGTAGWVDLVARSGRYPDLHADELHLLRTAAVVSFAVSASAALVWLLLPVVRRAAEWVGPRVAAPAAGLVAAVLLLAWLVRPHVQTALTHRNFPVVRVLQAEAGLPIEPTRSYAESTLEWMGWYLGAPALLAAIAGLAWGTWRALRGRATPATLGLLALCLGAGALYWWDPQITPDQLWATRRFVPAVFPALAAWAVIAVGVAATRLPLLIMRSGRSRGPRDLPERMINSRGGRAGVTVLVVGALLVPPILGTAPVAWQRTQSGFLEPVRQACALAGPDAALVVIDGAGVYTLPQSLRGWCDVPVAAVGTALDTATPAELAALIAANGRHLVLVSTSPVELWRLRVDGGPQVVKTEARDEPFMAERTLDRPPSGYQEPARSNPIDLPFRLYVLPVEP